MESKIKIRSAQPKPNEGLIYARFLDETSEGFIKSMLGKDAYNVITEAYIEPDNEYSFENASFAEHEGEIVGMVSGYTKNEKENFNKEILKNKSPLSYSIISKVLSHFLGPKEEGEFYLQAIYVGKMMRGKGIGLTLIKYVEDMAIEKGADMLSLDVSSKNDRAITLYKHQGMIVDSLWPNLPLIPSVFTRFTKDLC